MNKAQSFSPGIEWQTFVLILATYIGFALVTWFFEDLPWIILMPLGGYLVCLFGSVQHEAVHGHPTRVNGLNEALVFPALGLWMPFRRYKALHIAHHHDDILTDPADDPESYYWTSEQWAGIPPLLRPILRFNNTLLGRLSIGPIIAAVYFTGSELYKIYQGEQHVIRDWCLHALGVAIALYWIMDICAIPLWQYILLFAYPGLSLTLLRSFAEHRAHQAPGARTAVLETGPLMSLLYLNNNLHAAHHDAPRMPWYALPRYYQTHRQMLLQHNDGYLVHGYRQLFRRYMLRGKEPTVHPLSEQKLNQTG